MKNVILTEKKPIKLWLDDIEDGALEQARNIANLPFLFKHVALMPDCHVGYGVPIGTVLVTKEAIIPNAVGVDIGCGMSAIKSSINVNGDINDNVLRRIMQNIRKAIPVGFSRHQKPQDSKYMPDAELGEIARKELNNATHQIGTLGGGNHFIEIQKDTEGFVWIMIHSGSRNLGLKVANHYDKLARNLNEKWFSQVKSENELAFLPITTEEAKDYMIEMSYCSHFALCNRELMIKRVVESFEKEYTSIGWGDIIDIHHNYLCLENHFGKNVLVHRKGATSARTGEIGIIPSSQGTNSYIVKGLGNKESFTSCSHGAGRKLGRKRAQNELDLHSEIDFLNKKGIIHSIRNTDDLDEASGAYKDINVVMENQNDLVEVVTELTPLAVIKG